MNPISILFYALASFMGVEHPLIVSNQVLVTINPVDKIINIVQEDLFSIVMASADSSAVEEEWRHILKFEQGKEHNGLIIEQLTWDSHEGRLNVSLRVRYTDSKILEEAGIYYNEDSGYALINIPDWHIRSTDATLDGNYWVWQADRQVTFTLSALNNIPQEIVAYKQSMLPYWQRLSPDKD